ncbi:SusC/RagA family TonB-linked outer membrane protein [Sphingobacterium deserti]|uniref:TonB-dependent receptor plug n=1 Tax=Sphingobacterium deserti TaxID=1229276 RepID=A0A0B8T2U0_9SPHI|nr:SusC/RagA family TonB-linked outer membrane protein [Sphingobacterium deserti]KGE15677.1 TonB-dependent receptor plug [Sphingobacterium deserti]
MKYFYHYAVMLVICIFSLGTWAEAHADGKIKMMFGDVQSTSFFQKDTIGKGSPSKPTVLSAPSDTVGKDSIDQSDVIVHYNVDPTKPHMGKDSVYIGAISRFPFIALPQYLKGAVAGLYGQETSGEPGTVQQAVIIRGLSHPVFTPYDIAKNKPLIILDGVPLIEDPTLVYDIQDYALQPIGAATSLQTIVDMDNIESIKVMKDYSTAGIYGPRAANGAIYITTKNARPGNRRLTVNAYTGFTGTPTLTTINAEYEKNFRQVFYNRYSSPEQQDAFPAYLSDSSNTSFYGPSNWTDEYYEVTPLVSANASLSGGGARSNFRVFAGHTTNASGADDTKFGRYQTAFYVNMLPVKWLTISSMLQMSRLNRDRNRSLSERFAETRFFPDMSTPLAPNKDMYGLFLNEYDKVIDDNVNNSMVGRVMVNFALLKNLNFSPRFSIDYNENKRDVFWPSTLMDGNNYVSNYFGYNERMAFDNILTYDHRLSDNTNLLLEAGMNYQTDAQKYNYGVGYRGPNDFIRVNVVNGNSNDENYLRSVGFIPYYYADRTYQRLMSFYGRLTYGKTNQYKLAALLRRDGSSAVQPNSRWFNSFNFNGEYDFNYHFEADFLQQLKLTASYGRMAIIPFSDREAAGPYYTSGLGWDGNRSMFSYNGVGTINRPYDTGWVGYDLPWSYNDLANVGLEAGFLGKFTIAAEYYNRHTQDIATTVPTVAESGYRYEVLNGMSVRNSGVDLTVGVNLPQDESKKFGWIASFNIAYNNNKLTALPGDLQEIILGERKLIVGERIDRFWLLNNEGIFLQDADVPKHPQDGRPLTYNGGTNFRSGDPIWEDVNGDYNIDDQDRRLMGNIMPKYMGGFYNQFTYGRTDLSFQLYFHLGRQIINAGAAKFFDFVNTDEARDMDAVRDITYWEKNFDDQAYPLYNPWSAVAPYQAEQNLFLEDGSFIKLRSLSLGYDLTDVINGSKQTFSRFYAYITGNNLLTFSKYSGRDPELVNFYGYDNGLGIRFPRTFTMGVKLDF